MRQFHTVVLERLKEFTTNFDTEPYEVGWAREAMFFIRAEDVSGDDTSLESAVQVSADGIHWIDEGTRVGPVQSAGDQFVRVSHFGGWLRLRNTVAGEAPKLKMTIHLVLKE